MAERRGWIVGGVVLVALVVVAISRAPSGYVYPATPRLSTNLSSPDGAKALYLTLRRLGVPVSRREAPLVDAGPLPAALALLAPTDRPTPGEISAALSRVRAGGRMLWVAGARDPLGDSLRVHLRVLAPPRVGAFTFGHVAGVALPHPWTEGVDSVHGFRFGFVGKGLHAKGVTPLVTVDDSVVLAFVADVGAGRIVAFSDREPVENRGLLDSGAAPILVRAAAALAGRDTLVFDEFHHGFRGGSVRQAVTRFLVRWPSGHVVAQLALVGLLALAGMSVRMGEPLPPESRPRRSPIEHVDALARVYQEAGAQRRPRLLLLGGLARAAGEAPPRSNVEAASLLDRLARRGGDVAASAGALREGLGNADVDLVEVSENVDRIREGLVASPGKGT